jgi:hypothetical protein
MTPKELADLNTQRVRTTTTVDELRAEDDKEPLPDGKGAVILDPNYLLFARDIEFKKQAAEEAAKAQAMAEQAGVAGIAPGTPGPIPGAPQPPAPPPEASGPPPIPPTAAPPPPPAPDVLAGPLNPPPPSGTPMPKSMQSMLAKAAQFPDVLIDGPGPVSTRIVADVEF